MMTRRTKKLMPLFIKQVLMIFPLFLISISTYSKDDIRVTGTVLEASGFHRPISFASVRALNTSDSTIVAVAAADEYSYENYSSGGDNSKTYTGGFTLVLPREKGKYILSFTAVGYEEKTVDIDLGKLGRREYILKLPPVYLAEVSQALDEVVVTASGRRQHARRPHPANAGGGTERRRAYLCKRGICGRTVVERQAILRQ